MPFQLRERTVLDLDGSGGGHSFHPAIQSHLYEIIHWDLDEGDANPEVVGQVSAMVFYPWGYSYEELVDAADEIDDDAVAAVFYFYGEDGPFRSDHDSLTHNLLYISRVEVKSAYRGRGLGLQVVRALHERHGGTLNVALTPCPLEGDRTDEAVQKLWDYWSKLRFNREDEEGVWLWNDVTYQSEFPHGA